ncbi:MAG: hypothetical protein LLF76_03155 [Planctomycetaceae bacterium]|nr:hypothetical protein [Planctomycetaceae bacterium]
MAKCGVCGCTDYDCRQCVEKTGEPCWWFGPDLCSACAMECRGLTLWQPWAGFVAMKLKPVETRFWYTRYRGPVLICSAQKSDEDWVKVTSRPDVDDIQEPCCVLGHALCVANLVDCRAHEKRDEELSMVRFEGYAAGRFSWVFDKKSIKPVMAFPVRGRQRLFRVNESILRKAE